jgi:hypothetical protein
MASREDWLRVLDAEVKRWLAMSCDQLVLELRDARTYGVGSESGVIQVEVQLLENTDS